MDSVSLVLDRNSDLPHETSLSYLDTYDVYISFPSVVAFFSLLKRHHKSRK